MSDHKAGTGVIFLSFFISLMILIVPLSGHLAWYRPDFAMLVLMYWVMMMPHRVGVATGWCVGLLMDVLLGGILGQYALAMALIAYLTYRLHIRLRMFPIIQQMLFILILVGGAQVLIAWINYLTGNHAKLYLYCLPVLSTTLCWPLVRLILRDVYE